MNDMETEARRLLAAATKDRPPGIDLLDGFVAARRRDRARRMRGRAVLSAGVAAAAASVTAITLTIGSAPPALATVTSALTRTLAQSYHLTEQYGTYYVQQNGRITYPAHYMCVSEEDPVRHLGASSCTLAELSSREVGRYTYLYVPDPAGYPGKHWGRVLTASIDHPPVQNINDFAAATPQQMLSQIKKADKVTVVGPVSGPGWTGTRYAFTSSSNPRAIVRLSGTVDVDRQGRARALVYTMWFPSRINVFVMTQSLAFSDFGARVTVTPPPADQTFPW
jgi:hypothetical protein